MGELKIAASAFIAGQAVVLGNVTLGDESTVWFHATVRADREEIVIGNKSNVQDNAVIHVDEGYPVHIGEKVTIAHSAVIHGSSIGDNTLIGMGAILLNGSKIGKNCIIGAGALVPQNMIIPDNSLVLGSPGKIVRKVTVEEISANIHNAEEYVKEGRHYKIQGE